LGGLPRSLPLAQGHGHAFPGPHPQQVDLELGEGGEDVEEHLAHRVRGVVDRPVDRQPDPAGDEGVADVAGVGH